MSGQDADATKGDKQQGDDAGARQHQSDGDASGQQGGDRQQAKTFSQEDVNRLIEERLNRAKAKWDKDAEDAARKQAEKDLPEIDRLKAELARKDEHLASIAARQRDAAGREAVREAAKKAGAPEDKRDLLYRAVRGDIEFGDDGEPRNADQLIADQKSLYPDLFKAPVGKADAGAGTKRTQPAGDFMRAAYADRRG